MRSIVIAAIAVLTLATSAGANQPHYRGAPRCRTGTKPCYLNCIKLTAVCRGPPPPGPHWRHKTR
jgi:hypothetical protein